MDSLKNNFDTQQKIGIVSKEINNLETSLEKKTNANYHKAKNIEKLHDEALKYFQNIVQNLQPLDSN